MTRPSKGRAFADDLAMALRDCPRDERAIVFVSVLNSNLPSGSRAVLVGGALVEFYTSGQYTTGDIDIVGDRDNIVRLLESAGFERTGRVYVNADLDLVIDIAGQSLRRTETVENVEVEGYSAPVVSIEDTVVDRLLAAKFWSSRTDWEQATLLFEAHKSHIDGVELKRKARENEVDDWLDKLLRGTSGRK